MEESLQDSQDSLRDLTVGEAGVIVGIAGSQLFAKRLADMGFVGGARVEMVRKGNPCIVRIGPTCIGLGAANQRCVLIADRTSAAEAPALQSLGQVDAALCQRELP